MITSRRTSPLKKHFFSLGSHRVQCERITTDDTLPDIKLIVEAKTTSLVVSNESERALLVDKILSKSNGSFLWTVLVLNELLSSHSEEDVNQILEDVPRGMEPLYQRTIDLMALATRGKRLAEGILVWATCALRPLTVKELEGALKTDITDNVLNLGESILSLCGQLVKVDKFGKVQMVHETAREFLFMDHLESEFAVNKTEGNSRITKACLTYLTSEEMKPPRTGRRSSSTLLAAKRNDFLSYASTAFSDHLAMADPGSKDIFLLVSTFLKSNILSWIEIVASKHDLVPLICAAKNLKTYYDRCRLEHSPLSKEMQILNAWTTDLVRITAKFADAMIMSPSAIHSVILPFCPTESAIHQVTIPGRRLSILGLSNVQWDDRLSCMDFHRGRTSALCYGDEFLAVGLTTGAIALYHATTCQEYRLLHHGQIVQYLQFKSKTNLMASCAIRSIRVWDVVSGAVVHNFEVPERSIALAFDGSRLLAASDRNELIAWDLDHHLAQQTKQFWSDTSDPLITQSSRTPCAISVSVSHQMLAVAYIDRPIILWDIREDSYYGSCGKKLPSGETSTHRVTALVFNPIPTIGLLAASYLDGQLVLIDPFNDRELESLRANCHTLAARLDGQLLAGAAGAGTIEVYEFDSLRLLYRIKSSNIYIKSLAFSGDGLHLADIRGSQCNVWEPSVLLRNLVSDDSNEDTSTAVVETIALESKPRVGVMIVHPKGEVLMCGKDDGSVSVYSIKTGASLGTLYRHKSHVRILSCWARENVIMSVDSANAILAWTLLGSDREGFSPGIMVLNSRLNCGKSIIGVLAGEAAKKIVLSTRESDHFWNINGKQEDERLYPNGLQARKWIQHQKSPHHLLLIENTAIHVHSWSDWSKVLSVPLGTNIMELQFKNAIPFQAKQNQQILLELSMPNDLARTSGLRVLNSVPDAETIYKRSASQPLPGNSHIHDARTVEVLIPSLDSRLATLSRCLAHVIGFSGAGRLVFLDIRSWVCSIDLDALGDGQNSYLRHFYMPYDWFSGTKDVVCAVLQRDVIFARNGEVAIIKAGLEFAELVEMEVSETGTRET